MTKLIMLTSHLYLIRKRMMEIFILNTTSINILNTTSLRVLPYQ